MYKLRLRPHAIDDSGKKLIQTIGPRGDPLKIGWYCVFAAIAHESAMADLYTYWRLLPGFTNQKQEKQCFMYCDPLGPGQVMHKSVQAGRYSFVCTDSCVQDRKYRFGCTHSCVQVRTYRFVCTDSCVQARGCRQGTRCGDAARPCGAGDAPYFTIVLAGERQMQENITFLAFLPPANPQPTS